MEDLSMLAAGEFDVVVQPVSTCYVPEITLVYRQVARVTAAGGLYISQHKQPASLQAAVEPSPLGYELTEPYYRSGPLPPVAGSPHREHGTLEFLHRWEELIGGLCRSGFVVEDLVEPLHAEPDAAIGTFAHRSRYVAPYVRIKARRLADAAGRQGRLWTPARRCDAGGPRPPVRGLSRNLRRRRCHSAANRLQPVAHADHGEHGRNSMPPKQCAQCPLGHEQVLAGQHR